MLVLMGFISNIPQLAWD
uniref:Uncharacterized protein n=1 Tax=Arundo donax TaxID=35708 RepID=A0A0A9HCQ5_ARUDO